MLEQSPIAADKAWKSAKLEKLLASLHSPLRGVPVKGHHLQMKCLQNQFMPLKRQARGKVNGASISSWTKSKSVKLSLDMKWVYFIGFISTACICKSLMNKAFVMQAPKWIQVESVMAVDEHRDSLKGLLSFQINKLLWFYLIRQKRKKRTIWQPGGKIEW